MIKMNQYLLIPEGKTQESFYGKAKVREEDNKIILKSYDTDVCFIENNKASVIYNLIGNYQTATTLKHIKSFLKQNGYKADTKKQIMQDYYKEGSE